MPKINFNVPLRGLDGVAIQEAQLDEKKWRTNDQGQIIKDYKRDDDGNYVFGDIIMKKLISEMLLAPFQNDNTLPFDERAKRGKLAKKIERNDEVNYSMDEINIITDLAAKSRATLVLQNIDDLINPTEGE